MWNKMLVKVTLISNQTWFEMLFSIKRGEPISSISVILEHSNHHEVSNRAAADNFGDFSFILVFAASAMRPLLTSKPDYYPPGQKPSQGWNCASFICIKLP